ncbi:MAG: hypothetical protein JXA94_07440 [Parachlamydiales bacterium]|nr:hypothetical protein [Parachlamydiales bacterium]
MKKLIILFLGFFSFFSFADDIKCPNPDYLINETSRFDAKAGTHLFFIGEFLFWRTQDDGLAYVQTKAGNFDGQLYESEMTGPLKAVDPSWDPGFRIGLGYNINRDKMDVRAYWTRFKTDDKDVYFEQNGFALWGVIIPVIDVAHVLNSSAKVKIDLNVLDLEFGRYSYLGKNFSFRSYFGARGSWLDQRLDIEYNYTDRDENYNIFSNILAKSDVKGGGLRAGFDLRFNLVKGFSVFSIGSGSLLYGRFDSRFQNAESAISLSPIIFQDFNFKKDRFNLGFSQLQYAIGLKWDSNLANDRVHLGFEFGWEQNVWAGVNQMNHFLYRLEEGIMYQENGNLTFEGLTFKTRLDF